MKTCDELREKCRELYRCDRSAQILWHYTNVDGAIGIIETSSLRLGCHTFMNDPAEGLRSPELVTACWQAAVDKTASHPKFDLKRLRDTDDVFGDFTDYKQHPEPTFLVSMTVEPDSLSQIVTDFPLETHVFTSLFIKKRVYVATRRGVWRVDGDKIALISDKPPKDFK